MADRIEVTLYTRADCPLCDKAKAAMREGASQHHLPVVIREVDIDRDPALRERFTNDVPVIYVGAQEAFRHRVTAEQFAAAVTPSGSEGPGRAGGARMSSSAPTSLANEKCVPCHGGVPPVTGDELSALHRDLGGGWRVVEQHHLEKEFAFPDFVSALAFANRVGAVAEEEGHHPDLLVAWGRCASRFGRTR